ncbi:hypothetical protein M9H77_03067 [Catharanthus roseus]|uniref:Uncharacterized protein n=1 Tax=Catharanthus roseus TaxID=4058 RepID=A0ACC0CAM4_CATRO|nr:hypothetical protein M9H77_03067 [Catharanthus roseus]
MEISSLSLTFLEHTLKGNTSLSLIPYLVQFLELDPLMSSSVMFDPSCYGFGNLDDTSRIELNIVGFVFEFDRNSLQHVCTITSTRGRRHTMEFKGQGESEFMRLLHFRKKMSGSLKVFKAHLCDLEKTAFGNRVFERNLKNLVEKHLVYSIASIDFLFKDETLNESIVQNTKSCVKIKNQSLGATLLYSLTFKEFLDELIFRRELKVLQVSMNGFKDESFQMRGG